MVPTMCGDYGTDPKTSNPRDASPVKNYVNSDLRFRLQTLTMAIPTMKRRHILREFKRERSSVVVVLP